MRVMLLVSLLFITSCDNWLQPESAMFDKYHQRLANVLDVPIIPVKIQATVTIPAKRTLFEPLPRLSIGLLESYQLRQCGLFNLLAEKNSQLGKVQDAFYDFDYQMSLLKILHACLTEFQLSDEEHKTLADLYAKKWQHFITHLDNLLLTSDVMQKQLTASDWLPIEGSNNTRHVSEAFRLFNALYDLPYQAITRLPDNGLIQYQEGLEKSRLLGRLYYSMLNASQWLNSTTLLLNQNQKHVLCGKNRDTTQFRYLRNVFHSIYIEELQPYLAILDSTYQQVSDGAKLVETRMALHGQAYGITSAHQAFRQAILDHAQFWQRLFKRCDVRIGDRATP